MYCLRVCHHNQILTRHDLLFDGGDGGPCFVSSPHSLAVDFGTVCVAYSQFTPTRNLYGCDLALELHHECSCSSVVKNAPTHEGTQCLGANNLPTLDAAEKHTVELVSYRRCVKFIGDLPLDDI